MTDSRKTQEESPVEKQPFWSTDLFASLVVASIWLAAFSITAIASFI